VPVEGRDCWPRPAHERTVRVWDPETGILVSLILVYSSVTSGATLGDILAFGTEVGLLALRSESDDGVAESLSASGPCAPRMTSIVTRNRSIQVAEVCMWARPGPLSQVVATVIAER
jgi:hypothetical protein